jgi:hypothetical protein
MAPLQDFASRLEAAINAKDLSAVMALYRTNGVPAADLAVETARWQRLLARARCNVAEFSVFVER